MRILLFILFPLFLFAQTRRVPLTVVGGDMSSNIKTVISDPLIEVIELERSGNGDILVNSTIDIKGKVLKINPGTRIIGNYKITNAVIDASKEENVFGTTGTFENIKSTTGAVSVKWFGAVENDGIDDYAACQKAIDVVISSGGIGQVKFPYGHYLLSKGLNVRRSDSAGMPSRFVSITLQGEVSAFDIGPIGAATTLTLLNPNGAAINIQKGKGCVIEYIYFQGQNRLNLSPEEVVDENTNWTVNASSNKPLAPHAGIAVDRFGQPSIPESERDPDYRDLYTEVGGGGSTDIIIRNCAFRYFTVGVAVSTNSTTQNAEIVKVKDCWIDYVRVCVSTGNSQTRTVIVEDLKSWGNVEVVIDSERYGGGGAIPELRGANFAGAVKYLLRTTNVGLPVAVFNDVYAETLYAVGGRLAPGASTLQLNLINPQLNFMGGEQSTSTPTVIVRCAQLNIIGGHWTYYSHNTYQPMPIDCSVTTVIGAGLYGLLWDINSNSINYQNVKIFGLYDAPLNTNGRTIFPGIEEGRMVAAEGSYVIAPGQKRTYAGPLTTVAGLDADFKIIDRQHISFEAPGLHETILGGEFVMVQGYGGWPVTDNSTNSTGYFFVLGIVSGVDGQTITVKNVPRNLDLSAGRFRFYLFAYTSIYKTHIADIEKGSTYIRNIVGEGNGATQKLDVGDIVSHPAFPGGTRIVGIDNGLARLNQAAMFSEVSAAITSTNYIGEARSNIDAVLAMHTSNFTKVAWKKGDRILNDFSNPQYNNVTEWICIKSGIVGSNNPPKFISK